MSIKGLLMVKIFAVIIGLNVIGLVAYLPLRQNTETEVSDYSAAKTPEEQIEIILQEETPVLKNVSPTLELDALIEGFSDEIIAESKREISLAESRIKNIRYKENGGTYWGSKEWMKEPEYYKGLATSYLAEECFDRSTFAFEMMIFDDSEFGLGRLDIHHNGFSELFKREDFVDGIIHTYYYLGSQLQVGSELKDVVRISLTLSGLEKLFYYELFKKQAKGREKELLSANLYAIKQYCIFLNSYKPEDLGMEADQLPGFYCEPCSLVRVALLLTREVDPACYNQAEDAIRSVRWTQEQRVDDIRQYLNMSFQLLGKNAVLVGPSNK